MSTSRLFLRSAVLTTAVGVTALATAGIASAHVTANVYGDQPAKGGYGAIVLRVPNEDPKLGTTEVQLTVPTEYGITSARTKPVPGWKAEVSENDDVITSITWTAEDGHEIEAGTTSYEEFEIVLGALPDDVDTLVLPATQTYSDGKVVKWDEEPTDGAEPENPAPVVELAAASAHGHGGSADEAANDEDTGDQAADGSDDGSDDTARWLGGGGLVLGALGLGFGIGAILRAKKVTKS